MRHRDAEERWNRDIETLRERHSFDRHNLLSALPACSGQPYWTIYVQEA